MSVGKAPPPARGRDGEPSRAARWVTDSSVRCSSSAASAPRAPGRGPVRSPRPIPWRCSSAITRRTCTPPSSRGTTSRPAWPRCWPGNFFSAASRIWFARMGVSLGLRSRLPTWPLSPTASRGQHHRAATVDQHAPQVAVAAFADVSESPVAAARVFARRQPDPARKLAPATERMDVTDRADQGGRPQQSDTGHGLQQRADRVGGGQLPKFAVRARRCGPPAPGPPRARWPARAASRAGNSVADSSSAGTACTAVFAPGGRFRPCSPSSPRRALMRAVRVVIHCSRTRCNATRACCSGRLIGTAGIRSTRDASTSASASARSVLFRRTNGRT